MAMPNIQTRLANVTKALYEHAKNGNKYVDKEEYERRLKICSQCELRENENCPLCGCHMPTKCWWETSKCEDGRW